MPTYALARLIVTRPGPELFDYLRQIDATLAPFGGRYLVHGVPVERLEGDWPPGDLILLAFPNRAAAHGWYASPAYQAIKPLRTASAEGDVIFVEGVAAGHRGADLLAYLDPPPSVPR
ncbi:hypothetical protein VZ95_02280 [Elstera litoralis]|uniref:DUF1330 domain-containing protein n=1 Tax=Elstera litoralis TaxID=552518 RepID=A0A0F3IZ22_9PROT|nr:DUF1330 domain-containing protein [Elstera litoralis]KJV10849.1 hypothetical protein VZ95_02280 [Elstera litoralis]